MKLDYQTRENIPPTGRPQVYFTAHPADYAPFFQRICDELLHFQNCAVYYDTRPEEPWTEEELRSLLGQMKLFVIPVTRRFLRERNRALAVEFPFAMARHIPVLPLLQEAGLEEEFNQLCGNLQILAREDVSDKTKAQAGEVLSYPQKLEKYLASVLVEDALAEQVRAAFDAYVFLSYRKKDRAYAQRLMKLIHSNDFCRDIAVWYDEFLTPGEDFNAAIRDALAKSRLFTLAVTPSLLEEGNYVATTEYPKAGEAGKPIFPVKMADTDTEKLKKMYQNLPDCIDADNEKAFTEALLQSLSSITLRENDQDPKHNFFIGLAYLSGIDVEVDAGRALSLIHDAAQAGLPEAAQKLTDMYRTGNGVEINYQKAAGWQEHLADLLSHVYENSPTEENGLELNMALRHLADYLRELGDFQKAAEIYQKSCLLCEERIACGAGTQALRDLSASRDQLGTLLLEQGLFDQAVACFQEGLEADRLLYQRMAGADSLNTEEARNLSVSCNHLGELYLREGKWEKADEYFRQSLPFAYMVHVHSMSWESYSDLATTLEGSGRAVFREGAGDIEEARKLFLQVMEYRETALKLQQSPQTTEALSVSCYNFGITGEGFQELDTMWRSFQLSQELAELYPEVPAYRTRMDFSRQGLIIKLCKQEELSNQCKDSGDRALSAGQPEESKAWYTQAIEHLQPLFRWYPEGNPDVQGALAELYRCMARSEEAMHHLEAALSLCQKALALLEPSATKPGELEKAGRLCRLYNTLGDIYLKTEDVQTADAYYTKGIQLCTSHYESSFDPGLCSLLAQFQFNQAVTASLLGRQKELCDLLHYSEYLWSRLAALYPYEENFQRQRDWTRKQVAPYFSPQEKQVLAQMEEAARYRGHIEGQLKAGILQTAFDSARSMADCLSRVIQTPAESDSWLFGTRSNAIRSLCECYERMGNIFDMDGQPDKAFQNYDLSLQLRRTLANTLELPEDREALALACIRIGNPGLLQEAENLLTLLCIEYPFSDRFKQKRKELLARRFPD